jgi:hypothetical protein
MNVRRTSCRWNHGLIFNRIEGLETPSAPFKAWGDTDVTGFAMTPGQVNRSCCSSPSARTRAGC